MATGFSGSARYTPHPYSVKKLIDLGLTPKDAYKWYLGLRSPNFVALLPLVSNWRKAGFEKIEDVTPWIEKKWKPEEAKSWKMGGFTPEEAMEWKSHGWTARKAKQAINEGKKPTDK